MFRVNMMRIAMLALLISFWSTSVWLVQSTVEPEISSPQHGEVLQGQVTISGSSRVPSFQSAEITFSHDGDSQVSWFLLYESQEPIERGEFITWDTTTITDGNYQIRLRVYLEDNQVVETLIKGLRVRNYSPVETATPELAVIVVEETATMPVPTRTPATTPSPLPLNPALVTQNDLQSSFVQGFVITLAIFGLFGIYLALKKLFQRS
jgi:hypothetical protein